MELSCPKCQGTMRTYERNGVTIDQCSECRGIFLDRGELEKLVDAESAWSAERSAPRSEPPREQHHSDSHQSSGYPRRKRKESFFEDLFG